MKPDPEPGLPALAALADHRSMQLARSLLHCCTIALFWAMAGSGVSSLSAQDRAQDAVQDRIVFEDFEDYNVGDTPYEWSTNKGRSLISASPETMSDRHRYRVLWEDGNKFVRAEMRNYAYRLIRLNEDPTRWNLETHPVLQWDWRIHRVPEGAREDRKKANDTAGAVYVTFGRDWLGRPKSIKYSFSSTLPVGTVLSDGQLRILVVGSAATDELGKWRTMRRNVVEDYRLLFGGSPDSNTPVGITLFSDADDVRDDTSKVDFDDVILLAE